MDRIFEYRNISFKQRPSSNLSLVTGEVVNKSGRDYSSVIFRLVVFKNTRPIANITFNINGFIAGQTRTFEKHIEDIEYAFLIQNMNRYEIYAESAY